MKDTAKCKACGNEFEPVYRNGIKISAICYSCLAKKARKLIAKKEREEKVKKSRQDINTIRLPALLEKAQDEFNLYIRNRDRLPGNRYYCPTCDSIKPIVGNQYQACHVWPAGFYPALRFHELNVWGGCKSCNYYKHGSSYTYNDWLKNKIGEEKYMELQKLADLGNKNWKWDRQELIGLLSKYKELNKKFKENGNF